MVIFRDHVDPENNIRALSSHWTHCTIRYTVPLKGIVINTGIVPNTYKGIIRCVVGAYIFYHWFFLAYSENIIRTKISISIPSTEVSR